MSVRARLTAPPAGDPFARVAGMSVLLRQLLSLQDAGVGEVDVEGLAAGQLPEDPRLTLRVSAVPSGLPENGDTAVLRARLGLIWHRLLPRRLLRAGYRGDIEAAALEKDEFVVAASDEAGCRRAEDLLLQALLKATDGLISRSINRRISLRVTRLLLDTSLTPNQMTVIAALFGFAAILVVAVGGAAWLVPGALLLQVQSILDGCDGEISRLKYIRSRLGEWLDQVLDDVVNVGFFAAAGLALAAQGSVIALPLTIAGTALHLVYQAALYAALVTRGGGSGSVTSIRWWGQKDHDHHFASAPAGPLRRVKETIEAAMRRDFFTFLYLPAALLDLTEVALLWSAFIFILSGAGTGLQWLLGGGPEPAPRGS
jgi:phosphatidylglycerophosphate synthase